MGLAPLTLVNAWTERPMDDLYPSSPAAASLHSTSPAEHPPWTAQATFRQTTSTVKCYALDSRKSKQLLTQITLPETGRTSRRFSSTWEAILMMDSILS